MDEKHDPNLTVKRIARDKDKDKRVRTFPHVSLGIFYLIAIISHITHLFIRPERRNNQEPSHASQQNRIKPDKQTRKKKDKDDDDEDMKQQQAIYFIESVNHLTHRPIPQPHFLLHIANHM